MPYSKPWFKEWFNSPYYHQLYFKRDQKEAADFIDTLVNHLKPAPGKRMLDIACGKGRHSVQLAAKGFDVTGMDLSEESIKKAKKKENDHLHFFVHDMRLPFRTNYFDYAFNFFTSCGYFDTTAEHDSTVESVTGSLRAKGTFVIDYLNVNYSEDHIVPQSEIEIHEVNYFITKWSDESHFYKKIIVEDEKLNEQFEYREKVAKFSLADFRQVLSFHQMQIEEVFGDYRLNAYDEKKSPRMIIIARK